MHEQLYDIAKSLHEQHLDNHSTFQTLLSRTGIALDVDTGCLMTFKEKGEIDHVYYLGAEDTPEIRNRDVWQHLFKNGIIGYVYHSNRSVTVRNIAADPRWGLVKKADFLPSTGSAIGIPIQVNFSVLAVMVFVHPTVDYFNQERVRFLREVSDLASEALTNVHYAIVTKETSFDTRYHTIFEHTPVPVVLTDADGVIVDANYKACEFVGFQRAVLRGIPLQDVNVVSPKDMGKLTLNEEKYLPTNIYDIDGNAIPTLVRARLIELDGKQYIEWILQDMSVQTELENLRRDLTAMVYHDLRGPISSINMALGKLSELVSGHDNPYVPKIMQLGLRSTRQLVRLVDTLLDVQRLEQGATILDKQPSKIHQVLTDALHLVLPNAEAAGVTIDLDITKVAPIEMDSDMITRVVINLMENGIKYTPENGQMTVRAERADDELKVSVSDTGPGIPEAMRISIFDKYSRVKYQDAPKGVGLGLAFCRLAIEAHGGRIWVESDGENGSDFIFTLPFSLQDESEADDTASATDSSEALATTA